VAEAGMVHARIDLEFEGLRATCATFLVKRQDEIQAMVNRQLDAQLASGQIEKLIAAQIEREVADHLRTAIKEGVKHAFWDKAAKNKLTQVIVNSMVETDEKLKEFGG